MKIAFFGSAYSFDYHHIGGTDSIARRLGYELVRRGEKVDFVHFDAPWKKEIDTPVGIHLRYCSTFVDGLQALAGRYDHVVTIYVPPRQRLAYASFRHREARRTQFHLLYAGWPESWVKRELLFLESRLAPYNGYLFCVSPRQHRYVSQWSKRALLLLPPVPEEYFLSLQDKPRHDRMNIVYLGRVDSGKGIAMAIALFKYLGRSTEFESRICGYPWKHNPESMRLHNELLAQDDIFYTPTDFTAYSPKVDDKVHEILRETDVLFLPYDKLSSTIDTPLVLLEGIAHLCAVVTRPLGNLPEIYGTKEWMLDEMTDHRRVKRLLRELAEGLAEERHRLIRRNRELKFNLDHVVEQFCEALQNV